MTDESNKSPGDAHAEPVAGERLASARRARDISIHEIAKELHLDEPKVRALEQNDFDTLGAPVFAKGYLRKYAELVGVPADDVLADYYRFDRSTGVLPILGMRRKPPRDISLGPWLVGILVIAIVAGGIWLWFSGGLDLFVNDREPATLAPFASDDATEEEIRDVPQVSEPDIETAEPLTPGTTPSETEPSASVQEDAVDEAIPEDAAETVSPAVGQVELRLTFSGDCWTEVSDASGERLYFGLGSAGRTVSVTGTAPLHVLLGDSENATVAVDGADYPIPPSARRGETARLTITSR